ncbi:hypothetical protein BC829DRAFT_395360 [Chytridium lagenaria]|nr:hypothetical protein BC829DRAFT_395360 [Chytridium lagenaria]
MRREGKVRCDAFNGQLVATNKTVRRLQRPEENLLPQLFLTNDPTISVPAFKSLFLQGQEARQIINVRKYCLNNYLHDLQSQTASSTCHLFSSSSTKYLGEIGRREKRMQEIKNALDTPFLRLSDLPKPHQSKRRTMASPLLQNREHVDVDCGVPIRGDYHAPTLRRLLNNLGFGENRDWGSLSDDEIMRIREMSKGETDFHRVGFWGWSVKNLYSSEEDAGKRVERDKWRVMARKIEVGCTRSCCRRERGPRQKNGFVVAKLRGLKGVGVEDVLAEYFDA